MSVPSPRVSQPIVTCTQLQLLGIQKNYTHIFPNSADSVIHLAVKGLLLVEIQKSDYFRFTESGQLMPAIQT